MNNTAIKFMPVEAGEKRFELSLDGGAAVIRLSSWVDGLGWCGEKTMQIESDMLDEMHRIIGAARIRLRNQNKDAVESDPVSHKILDFPQIA